MRLYGFCLYSLSGIQKGIQFGHAAVELSRSFSTTKRSDFPKLRNEWEEFADLHKTFILLDGGGSEDMKQRAAELSSLGVRYGTFHEPDLNNTLSAIAFIVPEGVYSINVRDPHPEEFKDSPFYELAEYLSKFRLASN